MSEQEKFDELIRQKFEEKEFIFNEENWEKAEQTLDSAKRSKLLLRWGSIFLVGVIAGSSIAFFLTRNRHSEHPDRITLKQKEHTENNYAPTSQEPGGSNTQNTHTLSIKDSLDTHAADPAAIAENHNDPSASAKGQNDLSATALKTDDNVSSSSGEKIPGTRMYKDIISATKEQASSSGLPGNKNNSALALNKNKVTKNELPPEQKENNTPALNNGKAGKNSSSDKQKENTTLTLSKKKDKQRGSALNKEKTGKDASADEQKGADRLALNKTQTASTKKTLQNKKEAASKTTATDSNDADKKGQDQVTETADSAALSSTDDMAATAEKNAASPDSLKEEQKLVKADSVLPKVDSALTKAKPAELPLPMDGLASTTIFSIDAGMDAQLGWQYSDSIEGRGIAPIAGIGITHYFNQKWSVYTGVRYSCITNLTSSTRKLTSTSYGFGSTTTEITIKPGFLSYLTVPLTLQYHLNEANAILVGGTGGILLNKKNKIEKSISYVTAYPTATSNKTAYENYYGSSFNSVDATLCIGYRRKIMSRFTATAILHYGLTDVKKNAFFLKNRTERNSGLQLILSYNLFDF